MFYKSNNYKRNSTTMRVNIGFKTIDADDDPYSINLNCSPLSYNFDYKSGALSAGMGVSILKLPYLTTVPNGLRNITFPNYSAKAVWHFRHYSATSGTNISFIVAYFSDGYLYYTPLYSSNTGFTKSTLQYGEIPCIVNYRLNGEDVMIVTGTEGSYVWNVLDAPVEISNAPNMTSSCIHEERLFATVDSDKSRVYWSDDLDPTNWQISSTEAGFIDLVDDRGRLNKVLSFNDYVYIFRDFGISRISASGNESDFYVQNLYFSNNNIWANTVVKCSDQIVMMIGDELYRYDGINYVKINTHIDKWLKNIDGSKAKADFFDGKYYLTCRLNYGDNENVYYDTTNVTTENNTLLEYDLTTGDIRIFRGMNFSSLTAINDELYSRLYLVGLIEDKYVIGILDNSGTENGNGIYPKMWKTPYTDFDYANRKKLIKDIYLVSKEDITITIHYDQKSVHIAVSGKENLQKVRVNRIGKVFSIDIKSDTSTPYISNVSLIVDSMYD